MRKLSTILAVTFLSISTFASRIPDDKLESYKEAVKLGLSKTQLACLFKPANIAMEYGYAFNDASVVYRVIARADSAVLNDSSAQPVLTFIYKGSVMERSTERSVAVTTTADFLSIVAVDFSRFYVSTQKVNLGTIVNPNIVTQIVKTLTGSASCK